MFSTQSVRQVHDTTTEELLGEVFSVWSVLRCCKQDKSRIWLVLRQSPTSNDMSMEVEGSKVLEAIIKQWLMKTQQAEKT
jgi:hypothetical protein